MEIEGIIQHNLAALDAKQKGLLDQIAFCLRQIAQWQEVRRIHANETLQSVLQDINNIKQLLSSEKFMQYFLGAKADETFMLMGFHLNDIEFYMEIRNECYARQRIEREAELTVSEIV